ncbi:MAG: thermonuclease family protein, partial [Desulfovibrio sp.]|nr:thermonuclease family protein [Desulfovibrio sp.]
LVQVQDRSVNNRLVSDGLAWVDRSTCKAFFCRRWHIEEHLAQKDRRGIWSLNMSTPPWQWGNTD